LTPEELAERRHAVDSATVHNAFEGMYITDPIYLALREQYANGEIDLDALAAYVDNLKEEKNVNT